MLTKDPVKVEFGDFQTPAELCRQVVELLGRRLGAPTTVIEPTCGVGRFLGAARKQWPSAKLVGFDRNDSYLDEAGRLIGDDACLAVANFFDVNWHKEMDRHADPIVLLGNPPWVTNAGIGSLRGTNLPTKSNFQRHKGFDAKTGKANFDISEWMLIRLLEALDGREASVAMLLKTSVARKVLSYAWSTGLHLHGAEMRHINALRHFGASVSACLLIATLSPDQQNRECQVFYSLEDELPRTTIGWRDDFLVADAEAYDRSKHLWGDCPLKWRSGIKHDCSGVMEFRIVGNAVVNGMGERVDIEDEYLFPLLKTSEVAKTNVRPPHRAVLVTQRTVGDNTAEIAVRAPKTWAYLEAHGGKLDRRGSTIYRNRPRFSVFGVGGYTFQPWKVAISGFYKQTCFSLIPPYKQRPVMVDDATYFLGFQTEREAYFIAKLLNSVPAQDFLKALAFMDAKRPITVDLLRRLDLRKVADELGLAKQYIEILNISDGAAAKPQPAFLFQ